MTQLDKNNIEASTTAHHDSEQALLAFRVNDAVKPTRFLFLAAAAIVYLLVALAYIQPNIAIPQWYWLLATGLFAPCLILFATLLTQPRYQPKVRWFYLIIIGLAWVLNIALLYSGDWSTRSGAVQAPFIEVIYLIVVSIYLISPLKFTECCLLAIIPSCMVIALAISKTGSLQAAVYTAVFLAAFNMLGATASLIHDHRLRRSHWLQQRVNQHATKDALTLLANRRGFDDHLIALNSQHSNANRAGTSLILIRFNAFEQYRETYGDARSKRLIRALANRLKGSYRDSQYDLCARFKGSEFVGLWHSESSEDSQRLANYLQRQLQKVLDADAITHPNNITLTAGSAWQKASDSIQFSSLYQCAEIDAADASNDSNGGVGLAAVSAAN